MKWLHWVDCIAAIEVKDYVLSYFENPCYKCMFQMKWLPNSKSRGKV